MTERLSITFSVLTRCISVLFSVDKMLLPRYVNLSAKFKEPPFHVEMSPSVLFTIMPPAACFWLCSKDSAWVGAMSSE